MFRSPSEIVERVSSQPSVVVFVFVGLMVALCVGSALKRQENKPKYVNHKTVNIRGYVRKLGYFYEYGIKSIDSNIRQRLGFKQSLSAAEDTISMIMLSNRENLPVKSWER